MITIKVEVKATIGKVWDFWTQPEHITKWNYASDEWQCPSASNDLKPGGSFSYKMAAKDGSMEFDFEGTYTAIDKETSIVYKMSDGRTVRINFEVQNNLVVLTEAFEAEGSHSDEQQRAGWQAILENFKKYVESTNA